MDCVVYENDYERMPFLKLLSLKQYPVELQLQYTFSYLKTQQ
jgi:hypothetical protein